MRTTAELRKLWGPKCAAQETLETFRLWSGPAVQLRRETLPYWLALDGVLQRRGYRVTDAGGHNCRAITGGKGLSLHAFGIALDINPGRNPYGREFITDLPPDVVREILSITTQSGVQAFRWGGDWDGNGKRDESVYDAMHFELQLSPAEVDSAPVIGAKPAAPAIPTLALGAKGDLVRKLQQALTDHGVPCKVDGGFGPITAACVRRWQGSQGLSVDGIVGRQTWASLGVTW